MPRTGSNQVWSGEKPIITIRCRHRRQRHGFRICAALVRNDESLRSSFIHAALPRCIIPLTRSFGKAGLVRPVRYRRGRLRSVRINGTGVAAGNSAPRVRDRHGSMKWRAQMPAHRIGSKSPRRPASSVRLPLRQLYRHGHREQGPDPELAPCEPSTSAGAAGRVVMPHTQYPRGRTMRPVSHLADFRTWPDAKTGVAMMNAGRELVRASRLAALAPQHEGTLLLRRKQVQIRLKRNCTKTQSGSNQPSSLMLRVRRTGETRGSPRKQREPRSTHTVATAHPCNPPPTRPCSAATTPETSHVAQCRRPDGPRLAPSTSAAIRPSP